MFLAKVIKVEFIPQSQLLELFTTMIVPLPSVYSFARESLQNSFLVSYRVLSIQFLPIRVNIRLFLRTPSLYSFLECSSHSFFYRGSFQKTLSTLLFVPQSCRSWPCLQFISSSFTVIESLTIEFRFGVHSVSCLHTFPRHNFFYQFLPKDSSQIAELLNSLSRSL